MNQPKLIMSTLYGFHALTPEEGKEFITEINFSRIKIYEMEKEIKELKEQLDRAAEHHTLFIKENNKLKKIINSNNLLNDNYNLVEENERLKEENDKLLDELAEIREILLPHVNINNSCGDMLACTVGSPYCIKCLAKNIAEQFKL